MQNLINTFMDFRWTLWEGLLETLYMTFTSVTMAYAIGLPMGVLLVITHATGLWPNSIVHTVLSGVVNSVRSVPFIILIVVLMPFTRLIVGSAIGTNAAIVALVIAAAPFIARMVETSLNELDAGVIDAAKSMGATNFQIIRKVMLPESIPSLIRGFSITTIMLMSFSAMAGAVGAGGLGRIAIRYGYQRFQTDVMFLAVIIIVVVVALLQFGFNTLAAKIDKRLV
ncbi:MAG: ABC transporter permease [Clostridiales bacterium]|jgi:D-methionine transport system permease protein|nr:ABC transporter permease [Clostridiales bacterium]